jgi:hypothetical protein
MPLYNKARVVNNLRAETVGEESGHMIALRPRYQTALWLQIAGLCVWMSAG